MQHNMKIGSIFSTRKSTNMMLVALFASSATSLPVFGETTNESLDVKKTIQAVVDIATQWPSDLESSIAAVASHSFPLPDTLETTESNIANQSNDQWLAHVRTSESEAEHEMMRPDSVKLECIRFGQKTYARFRETFGDSPDLIKLLNNPETYQKAAKFGVSSGGVLGVIFATSNHPKTQEAEAVLTCKIEVPMTAEQMRIGADGLQSELMTLFPEERIIASGKDGEALTPSKGNIEFLSFFVGGKKIDTSFVDAFEITWIASSSLGFDPTLKIEFMVLFATGVS